MAYYIQSSETIQHAVQRIACEQVAKAFDEIDDKDLPFDETVHQVRKRCKKIRGLIRLVRPAFEKTYSQENKALRDAARRLSGVRDATSMLECFDALVRRYDGDMELDTIEPLRQKIEDYYKLKLDGLDRKRRLAAFTEDIKNVETRIAGWSFDATGVDAFRGGLKKTYKRGFKAMTNAFQAPSARNLHTWRKRVKYHWYHMRLLKGLWRPAIADRAATADRLSDLLGDDHDLSVLREALMGNPDQFGGTSSVQTLSALIDKRRTELRVWAFASGQLLYAEQPNDFARRFERYWFARDTKRQLNHIFPKKAGNIYS